MKKYFITLLFIIIITPSVAFASWWNPFTWKVFNKSSEIKIEKPITPPVDQINTSTRTIKEESKKKAEVLKKKINPVVSTPKPSAPPSISDINNDQPKPQIQNSQPVAIETWEKQEARDSAYADTKGWTSFTSTNALGEKRYYRKEGNQWVRKNSEAEAQTSALGLRVQEIEACLKGLDESEKSQNLCDDPTYDESQKAFCRLATGGLRMSQSAKFSFCTGNDRLSSSPSYSPPAYTPPPSYTPSYTPPSLTSDAQSWRKELEEDKFKRSVCEKAGGIYIGDSCI